ncbi:MAG: leucine-rich repeat domain-containing protein, partial [Christensenellales bacterium]
MKRVSARLLCKLLRVTSLALCLLLVLCLDGTVSHADTQVTINQIRYSLDTSGLTAEVMGGKPVNGSLTIPGIIQYNGQTYRVTSIAAKAFADQYLGAKLSLAEGLLSIGESAFAGCMALKGDITIPDSVISMGESAFDGAYVSSAYVLTLGKGLTALPRKAFANIWGWGIKGIIFRGTQYSDIAADAFSGSDFYETTVPVTVHGAYGSMDALLAGALTNGFSVTYLDPDAKNAAWLQAQIDAAPDGVETTIALSANVLAEQTIVVPGGKNIRLVNQDGTRTIAAAKTLNVLFLVENGAVLALDGTDDTALRLLGSEVSKSFTGNLLMVEKGASVY